MRWQEGGESENVQDQRGLPVGMALGGVGTVIVIVLGLLFGMDPRALMQQLQNQQPQGAPAQRQDSPEEARKVSFVKHVLFQTEQVWTDLFQTQVPRRPTYVKPTLVLFTGRVKSACGLAESATGPFYCPGDQRVYIDLSFYDELQNRFHAGGDFANAYVIAHEVGHHVQNLLDINAETKRRKVSRLRNESDNQLSVRLELQADFLAGVWAHYADQKWHILEQGDVQKAITAAQAIGDDRLQKQAQGYVVPEQFTHGRSDQRVRWFTEGLKRGDLREADQLFSLPYNAL